MANIIVCLYMQVQCGDVELERKIDEKIEQFIDKVEKHPNKKNQVLLLWSSLATSLFKDYYAMWYIYFSISLVKHRKGEVLVGLISFLATFRALFKLGYFFIYR